MMDEEMFKGVTRVLVGRVFSSTSGGSFDQRKARTTRKANRDFRQGDR